MFVQLQIRWSYFTGATANETLSISSSPRWIRNKNCFFFESNFLSSYVSRACFFISFMEIPSELIQREKSFSYLDENLRVLFFFNVGREEAGEWRWLARVKPTRSKTSRITIDNWHSIFQHSSYTCLVVFSRNVFRRSSSSTADDRISTKRLLWLAFPFRSLSILVAGAFFVLLMDATFEWATDGRTNPGMKTSPRTRVLGWAKDVLGKKRLKATYRATLINLRLSSVGVLYSTFNCVIARRDFAHSN